MGDTIIERPHAKLGGSSASRWMQCPGSVFLEQELPPQKGTIYTEEGTVAHECAEAALFSFLESKIEGSPDVPRPVLNCTREMIEHAEDYVKALWENALEKSITGKYYGLEDIFTVSKDFDMWGYTDFWCAHINDRGKRVGIVADYKYGYVNVKVDKNAQLAFYAVGMQEEFTAKGKELDSVKAIIYQPKSEEPYKETTFTASQLQTWKKKFLQAGAQVFIKRKPKFKTGEWCKYCKSQVICKKYSNEVITSTDLALVDRSSPLPKVETLTDNEIYKIVLCSEDLEKFIKECKKYAIARYVQGKKIEGLKVIQTSGRRGWKKGEDESIGEKLLKLGILDPFNKKLKGISEIEKQLKSKYDSKTVEKTMSAYTSKSQGTLHIVSEEDPRPGVKTTDDLLLELEEE